MRSGGRVPKPRASVVTVPPSKPRKPSLVPPDGLTPEARAKWLEIAAHVSTVPLASAGIADSITSYVWQWCTYRRMHEAVEAEPDFVVSSELGAAKPSPLLTAYHRQAGVLRQLAESLCMTPASLARVTAGSTPTETDDLDDFLALRTG